MGNPRRRRILKSAKIEAIKVKKAGGTPAAPAPKAVEAPAPLVEAPVVEEAEIEEVVEKQAVIAAPKKTFKKKKTTKS